MKISMDKFKDLIRDNTSYFGHLATMDTNKAGEISDTLDKNPTEIDIEFRINGIELDLEKFEEYIKFRFIKKIEKLSDLKNEANRIANGLIKEKYRNTIYKMFDNLEQIELKLEEVNNSIKWDEI